MAKPVSDVSAFIRSGWLSSADSYFFQRTWSGWLAESPDSEPSMLLLPPTPPPSPPTPPAVLPGAQFLMSKLRRALPTALRIKSPPSTISGPTDREAAAIGRPARRSTGCIRAALWPQSAARKATVSFTIFVN